MPRITTLGNIEIRVYPDDMKKHRMPHFHAASLEGDMVVSLPGLDVIAGSVRDVRAVLVWAATGSNLKTLMDQWDLGNPSIKVRRP